MQVEHHNAVIRFAIDAKGRVDEYRRFVGAHVVGFEGRSEKPDVLLGMIRTEVFTGIYNVLVSSAEQLAARLKN
jgi:hypothetical protein